MTGSVVRRSLLITLAVLLWTVPACGGSDPRDGTGEASAPSDEGGPEEAALRKIIIQQLTRATEAGQQGDDDAARQGALEALDAAIEGASVLKTELNQALFWHALSYADHFGARFHRMHDALVRSVAARESLLPPTHPELLRTRRSLLHSRGMMGDFAGAKGLALTAIQLIEDSPASPALELALARRDLAQVEHEAGNQDDGRSLLARAVADLEAVDGTVEPELSVLRLELAIMYEVAGEREGACEQFDKALMGSEEWLVSHCELQPYETGQGWQWAWLELQLKLSFLAGREAAGPMGESLSPLLEAEGPDTGRILGSLRKELVTALRNLEPKPGGRPSTLVMLADAYAGRLRGHTVGWRGCGRGGSSLVALHRAAERGDHRMVDHLLRAGIEPRTPTFDVVHWQPGEPLENVRSALSLAAAGGHAKVVQSLMDAGVDPDHRVPGERTPLSEAARQKGASGVVRILLGAGADPLLEVDGSQPLDWASSGGDYDSFLTLLEASRDAGMAPEREQALAEYLHSHTGISLHWMRQLVSREELTPLQLAARRGPVERLEELLAEGAEPGEDSLESGWRPLHWAAGHEGNLERLRALLQAGADANAATLKGYSPLIAAIQADAPKRVQALLDAGANPNDRGMAGESPLHVAARYAGPAVVESLLRAGADPKYVHGSWTPLQVAGHREHPRIERLLKEAL